jgi:hypothetical protein
MSVYRLDPTDSERPSWALSTEKDAVWAGAATPGDARDLVARKTGVASRHPGSDQIPPSPWRDEAATSCVWEPTMTHIRAGTVVRADGSLVGD